MPTLQAAEKFSSSKKCDRLLDPLISMGSIPAFRVEFLKKDICGIGVVRANKELAKRRVGMARFVLV